MIIVFIFFLNILFTLPINVCVNFTRILNEHGMNIHCYKKKKEKNQK